MTRLADWMKQEKMRATDIAQALGLAEGSIRKHVSGERVPDPRTIVRYVELSKGAVQLQDFVAQGEEFAALRRDARAET